MNKTPELVKKIAVTVLENTHQCFDMYFTKVVTPENPVVTKIKEVLDDCDFGCQSKNISKLVAALLSEMLGENVTMNDVDSNDINFDEVHIPVVLILTSNPNSHCYEVDVPVLFINSGDLGYQDGEKGNHVPKDISGLRLPTLDEVELAVNSNFNIVSEKFLIVSV